MLDQASVTIANGAGGGTASAPASDTTAQGDGELTFEKFVESLDDAKKGLLENHTKGLKSALEAERENRKAFEKQIRELAASAQKEGELRTQLEQLSTQLELSNRRAAFAEEAQREGVSNSKALFTLAMAGEFFDKKGNANFNALRSEYPEFFVKPIPKGNAGEGANSTPARSSMNDAIRQLAGVKTIP